MKGVILYTTKYGSTRDYAQWIAEATGLPVYDLHKDQVEIESFDFLVIGMPVIYNKLYRAKWLQTHLGTILQKPVMLFTVSGASAGAKLDRWIAASVPEPLIAHMSHVALRGRQDPKRLRMFDRLALTIAGRFNRDRQAGSEEMHGFDYMDRSSIQPVVDWTQAMKSGASSTARREAAAT